MKTVLATLSILMALVAFVGCGGLRDQEILLDEESAANIDVPQPRYYKYVEDEVEEEIACTEYRTVKKEIPYKTFKIETEQVPCRTWRKVEEWVPCKIREVYYEDGDEYCTSRTPVTDQYMVWEQSCDPKLVADVRGKVEYDEFYDIAEIRSELNCKQCVQTSPCADCHEKIEMRLEKITSVPVKRRRPKFVEDVRAKTVMDCDVEPVMKERTVMRQAWCKPRKEKKERIVEGRRLVIKNVMTEEMRTIRTKVPVVETRTVEVKEPYEVKKKVKRIVTRRVETPKCDDIPCPEKPKKVEFCDPVTGKTVVCDPCKNGGMCMIGDKPYIQKGKPASVRDVLVPDEAKNTVAEKMPAPEAAPKKDEAESAPKPSTEATQAELLPAIDEAEAAAMLPDVQAEEAAMLEEFDVPEVPELPAIPEAPEAISAMK